MLPQRSADGNTIDGGLGGAAQVGLVGDSSSSSFLLTVTIDGGVKLAALDRRDGLPSLPDVLGRGASVAPWASQAVTDHAGLVEVFTGPAAGMGGQGSLITGDLLVTSAGGLAGAVVLRSRTTSGAAHWTISC